jgi:hypothetical protein
VLQNAADIHTALNVPESRKLVMRMAFTNPICCFYEATLGVRVVLNMSEANQAE